MKEIWKDVIGYEGLYQISNLGKVKSLERMQEKGAFKNVKINEHILKTNINNWGYESCLLCKKGIAKSKKIHRLVGEAFIPNPDNLPEINHIDANRANNCLENLEWCTQSQNIQHAYNINKHLRYVGKDNWMSKPVLQYDKDLNFIQRFDCMAEAQRKLKINFCNISRVCNGHRKTAGGFIWRFEND